jgi:membrane-bound serine protease (ClpP class)
LPINWAGAALLILGVSLFVLEAKFASHGILGIGGTVAMVLGATLLIDGPPEMRIHLSTALAVTVPFALITMFLVTLVIRARANKAVMGTNTLIDQIAEARTALTPSGTVFLQGEYWNAESEVPVEKGVQVRVVSVEGLKLHVSPVGK